MDALASKQTPLTPKNPLASNTLNSTNNALSAKQSKQTFLSSPIFDNGKRQRNKTSCTADNAKDPFVFTVATSYCLGLHNLLSSLEHHGFAYKVLKLGEEWKGWRFRMQAYRDAALARAKEHGNASLVIFVDAYDVLCTRDAQNLASIFYEFQKPLLVGLESGCQVLDKGNCGDIDAYWLATQQRIPDRPNRYANGGFVMGEAHAVASAYEWMLIEGYEDDQVGLAGFVSSHPQLVAVDETSRVVENVDWFQGRSGRVKAGTQSWFVHFPGLKDWPQWVGYAERVKESAGPFGIAVNDVTNARYPQKLFFVCVVLALLFFVGLAAYQTGKFVGSKSKC